MSGSQLLVDSTLVSDHRRDLGCEFSTPVHDYLSWPRMARKPCHLQDVGDLVGSLIWDLYTLEPACCGIDHCEAVELNLLFFVSQ